MKPFRGEVWMVDLGMAAKTRPCVVLSAPYGELDRALIAVLPHTGSPRGSIYEVPVQPRFLAKGVFNVQGLLAQPPRAFLRKLGVLTASEMEQVEVVLRRWLGLG